MGTMRTITAAAALVLGLATGASASVAAAGDSRELAAKPRISTGGEQARVLDQCNQFPTGHPMHCSNLVLVPKCPPGTMLGVDCKHMIVEKEPGARFATLAALQDAVREGKILSPFVGPELVGPR